MNRRELQNYAGTFALIVLVVMVFGGWWLQRPITDRTLAIFGVILWATLQLDISALLPFDIVPTNRDSGSESATSAAPAEPSESVRGVEGGDGE